MKNTKFFFLGVLAVLLIFGVVRTALSGKKDSGGSGGSPSTTDDLTDDLKEVGRFLKDTFGFSSGEGSTSTSSDKANPASDFFYDLTADGQGILIKGYTGGPGKVVVPEKIEDIPVVEIDKNVFNGSATTYDINAVMNGGSLIIGSRENEKAGITSITLPNTIKKIGTSAFANTTITSFTMPDSVTEVAYDRITGDSFIFSGCKQLAEIRFSDNLELIPELLGGFGGLPALKKINVPKNLKQIGDDAFSGSGELNEVVIPDTLKTLEFVSWGSKDYGPSDRWMKDGEYNPNGVSGDVYLSEPFSGCGKLPIKTRQKLQELGYKGEF